MIVFLNATANNGGGLRKWEEVRPLLEDHRLGREYRLVLDPADLASALRNGLPEESRLIVAAGGDGTVNVALSHIMSLEEERRKSFVLGAVGLGSSNDFHKPHDAGRRVDGNVFARLDAAAAYPHNVGEVEYEDGGGERRRRFFILNCSLGIIAQANALFNKGGPVLDFLKRRFVPGAIYYAAVRTILAAANVPATITVGGETTAAAVTNLSVVINPHFSGNLRYDFAVDGRSDRFGVALCEGMGVAGRLRTLGSLAEGRFHGLPRTRSWTAAEVRISTALPTPLEMDGEVVLARDIRVRLLREKVRVCP
jgi:diacylglycerol kinase (ATP)